MKIKKTKSKNNNLEFDINDYVAYSPKLSVDRMDNASRRIMDFLPSFKLGTQVLLKDLELFLVGKYKAVKADWKDIDKCTRTKVKRYNKYCQTVFCVSECHVTDEDYYSAYIIKRESLINPSFQRDEFFYDLFLIVGSEDTKHLKSYYIGGSSEGFAEEMYVMCGNK